MKLSLALVAAANANQMDWMVNQWWEEAVQVFDFSNKNWAAFAGAVNAVRSFFIIQFLKCFFKVDESQYKPLWNYCNPDGDAALTTAELTDCGQRTGEWMGMQEDHQRFLYKFAEKYWSVVDQNKDGALSYDEFRFTLASFAATDAGVIIAAFDSNRDGKLESGELTTWRSTMEGMMGQWDWKPTPEMQACFANAWKHGDQNGNLADGTRHEIALFTLGSWNCLLLE